MKKKLNTLNEQLSRMKKLMKFKIGENSHDILSENFINEQDNWSGKIQDIYKGLGSCSGIIKQMTMFALELSTTVDKKTFTYDDFNKTLKVTKNELDREKDLGDTGKNSPLVQKILNFSKTKLKKECVTKFQELMLSHSGLEDTMVTNDGKKKYTDGVVGLLTLSSLINALLSYHGNIFKQQPGILKKRYFEKELTKNLSTTHSNKGENSKGKYKKKANTSVVDRTTNTKQGLKGK